MYYSKISINGTEYLLAVNISGAGKPTAATDGNVGMFYMDTTSGTVYKCTAPGTWKEFVGSVGPQGEPGPAGKDGVDGEDGKSAYQIALDTGFDGSETEWLASLKGEKGEKGDTGAQGEKGDDGTGVTILGSFASESDLKSAHPTGEIGDAYLVNGYLYVWSATTSSWENVGNIKGPQGDKGDKGDKGDTGEQGIQGIQGIQGEQGPEGPQGAPGSNGKDGTSVEHWWQGTTLYVKSANGESSANLKGADGTSVTVSSISESSEDGGDNVVTFSDGKKLTVKNGSKGSSGEVDVDGLPKATISAYGITKLSSSTSSTSQDLAATPYAVSQAFTKATTANTTASNAMPKAGGTFTGAVTAQNNTNYKTKQVRNIFLIPEGETPPSGANGDICLVYKP